MPWIKNNDKKKPSFFDFDHLSSKKPGPSSTNDSTPPTSKMPPINSSSQNNSNDLKNNEGVINLSNSNTLKDILVIDDEPDFLELYETIITPLKIFRNVISASDGAIALKKIQNQDFAMIIMDLRMPKMDGMKVLAGINSSEFQKGLNGKKVPPILLVSGNLDGEVTTQALRYKVKYILTKPFGKEDLINKIKEIMKNS